MGSPEELPVEGPRAISLPRPRNSEASRWGRGGRPMVPALMQGSSRKDAAKLFAAINQVREPSLFLLLVLWAGLSRRGSGCPHLPGVGALGSAGLRPARPSLGAEPLLRSCF